MMKMSLRRRMKMSKAAKIAKKWYDKGIWGIDRLRELVETEVITPEEFKEITGEDYE